MNFGEAEQYITGKLQRELPANLYYHSFDHVMDVLQAATMYASLEGVNDQDLVLLKTAVLFHDAGFTIQGKDHEEIGCRIARETLPRFGYSDADIERICGMIMATRIPQSPSSLLEEIICDADLDYLGRDDFYRIGDTLFRELQVGGVLKDERDWNRLQVKFLESHHYFTASAIKLRGDKKEAHTEKIRDLVKTYTQ
jgi:uncharacterized protein